MASPFYQRRIFKIVQAYFLYAPCNDCVENLTVNEAIMSYFFIYLLGQKK